MAASSSQSVRSPLRFSPASYSRQFRIRYRALKRLGRFGFNLKGMMGHQGWSRLIITYPVAPPPPTLLHQRHFDILIASLRELRWRAGETIDLEEWWGGGDASRIPILARELVALAPDVIVATGSSEARSPQAATQDISIVFMQVPDPVSLGIVESIARPGRPSRPASHCSALLLATQSEKQSTGVFLPRWLLISPTGL